VNSFHLLIQSIRAYLGLSSTGLERLGTMSPQEADDFVDIVEKQKAQAYVLQGLKNAGMLSYLPEDASDAFRYGAAVIAEESLKLSRVLHQVNNTLRAHEVDFISLKGPIFSMRATGGLSHRSFGDIDVLVHGDDAPKAVEALTGVGYREFYPGSIPVSKRTLKNDCEIVLLDPDDTIVEVHWAFQPKHMALNVSYKDVWTRAQTVDFFGTDIRYLSDIHELPHIALHHGGFHRWNELRYVVDFHQLSVNESLDWSSIWDTASAVGAKRPILIGLLVCKKVLGDDVEYTGLLSAALDETAEKLAGYYSKNLEEGDTLTGFQKNRWYLGQRERIADKLMYLPFFMREAVTPTEKDAVTLGKWSFPFLRLPFRMIRLIYKYNRRLVHTSRKEPREVDCDR
jgi:hypothetical protein